MRAGRTAARAGGGLLRRVPSPLVAAPADSGALRGTHLVGKARKVLAGARCGAAVWSPPRPRPCSAKVAGPAGFEPAAFGFVALPDTGATCLPRGGKIRRGGAGTRRTGTPRHSVWHSPAAFGFAVRRAGRRLRVLEPGPDVAHRRLRVLVPTLGHHREHRRLAARRPELRQPRVPRDVRGRDPL